MARRLRPGPAHRGDPLGRSRSDRAEPARAKAAGRRPRRGLQLVVWALALTVFGGLALLSGQTEGFTSDGRPSQAAAPAPAPAAAPAMPAASSPPAFSAAPAAQTAAGPGGRLLAAAPGGDVPTYTIKQDGCDVYNEARSFLPLHRWTSFELFVVDNARIFKTQRFVSMIASLMFMAAALCWRIIGVLMGFGYSFDMICRAADPINSVVRTFSLYAAWFLIPAWLFVLAAVVRRWSSHGGRRGPAAGLRLIMVFLAANGLIFFMGDQADKHQDNPTAAYTAPWMASTVQGWFGTASDSLYNLQQIGRVNNGVQTNPVFYDNHPEGGAGPVTCAQLDEKLNDEYLSRNAGTSLASGKQAMVQVSKMWEISLVRSWQAAQFGEGTKEFPSPAHASCRWLEANADVDTASKLEAYDLATGHPKGTTQPSMARGYFIDPAADEQMIMIAWGACKANDDGLGSSHTIPQWDKATDTKNKAKACEKLYSQITYEDDKSGHQFSVAGVDLLCFLCDNGTMGTFYFNGDDELKEKLGNCYASEPACQADWNYVSAWLGKNQAQRLTQGLMSMIVAFVFLFVMGPMAIGMTVSSVGLAALVMILPLTLLLIGAGLPQGMRLLKLTGAAAAGDALFTLGLTFLTMLTDTTYQAIEATTDDATPNFFQQVAQGAAPLVALYLFRKISKILSLGDISTTTGATGFASAIVLRSSGDRRLSRNAGQQVSQRLGRLGAGRARLAALDERSLQRRMLNNRATRAVAGAAGRRAQRAVRPVTDWARDRYDGGRARLQRGLNNLQRRAASGSPAQRAAAYAGLTAGLAGLTMVAPPAVLATLPLMAFTGTAAYGRGLQAAVRGIPNMPGIPGAAPVATGMPMAQGGRTGMRQADDWHRNIIRVSDSAEQRRLTAEHAEDGLNMLRARQWGGAQPSGLDPEFTGFVNDEEKMQALADMANATGLSTDQLLMGNHGLAIPVPAHVDKRSGQRVFPEGTSIEQASHPVHFLDRYTLQRQMVDGVEENDDQYIARLTAQLRERGYVTDGGQFVDVFAAHGLDTRVPEVRERVARFISGGRDEELSRIVITSRRAEDSAVTASRQWAEMRLPDVDDRRARDMEAVENVLAAASTEIGSLNNRRVDLPNGTTMSLGDLRGQLRTDFGGLKTIATQIRDLHEGRDAGTIPQDLFDAEIERISNQQRQAAQQVDMLCASLRDAVDASRTARGVCDLRVRLADPGTMIDGDELSRLTDQIARQNQQEQQRWHEEIDRLAGAISRRPPDAASAAEFLRDIDRLEDVLNKESGKERRANRDVFNRLKELQDSLEDSRRMTQTDPRLSASRPVDMRRLLRDMYSRT
ncbi:SoxR reducing system RseC family protein [Actinomadura sp. WMMA1423]|uniref:SoxR reducing system RseC family protein n=1 Tax=Actinomadura sp. WMMA1423 TaxID=2591108 RepID=UPI00143CCBF6|nr:SoxR reducing system RseC family protein [Actinomadura sp. WMMA1423]